MPALWARTHLVGEGRLARRGGLLVGGIGETIGETVGQFFLCRVKNSQSPIVSPAPRNAPIRPNPINAASHTNASSPKDRTLKVRAMPIAAPAMEPNNVTRQLATGPRLPPNTEVTARDYRSG